MLKQVRDEAGASAPAAWKIKVGLVLSGVVLLGGLAGGIIGAEWYGKGAPSQEQVKQIAAGKDFLQLLPQLDQATRDTLVHLIEKNHQQ